MSQLKLIEEAIKSSKFDSTGISKLPSNQLELVLAYSFKYNNPSLFEQTFKSIKFLETSIKNKDNLTNWLVNSNINNETDFFSFINNDCIVFLLHEGFKFDLNVLTKKFKNINLFKAFPYCDNISTNDFNSIFISPFLRKEYQFIHQRIYDTLDYHKKYNKDIPLKFFENLCKFIIPNCVIAEENQPDNPDLKECRFAIQEFIAYFSDKFNFFESIPKNYLLTLSKQCNPYVNMVKVEEYYNSMREYILRKKMQEISETKQTTSIQKKKI